MAIINVRDFGAKGDGCTLDTAAIQAAIDAAGKGEGFIVCAANAGGKIKDVTIENCHFIEENPSIVAGTDGNVSDVKLVNCTFEYKEGSTHPYFKNKLDLQPNIPKLQPAPFKTGDTLYVFGCENVTVDGAEVK